MGSDAAVGGERAEFGGAGEELFDFGPGVLGEGGDAVFAKCLSASGGEVELEKECEDWFGRINISGIGKRQRGNRVVLVVYVEPDGGGAEWGGVVIGSIEKKRGAVDGE